MKKISDFVGLIWFLTKFYLFEWFRKAWDKILYHYSVNLVSFLIAEFFWRWETRPRFKDLLKKLRFK